MNKLLFLLFFVFSIFLISCDTETPSNPCDACTSDQYCKNDVCFSYACDDEHPNGLCRRGEHCDDGACVVEYCSAEYPRGICQSDDLSCVEGQCQANECSTEHPNGVCPLGEVCLSPGVCGVATCSPTNTSGTCENGSECSSSGECILLPCNAQNTTGFCGEGLECVNGACLDIDRCSPTNLDGICGIYQTCDSTGTCVDINCSDESPDGLCPDGQFCDHVLESGEWHSECKVVPTACIDNNGCPAGYKCDATNICVAYSCTPDCKEKEICEFGSCAPDPFFCGVDCITCWCETGLECIENSCQVPINNPCSDQNCGTGTCIVTDWDDDNGFECVSDDDLCSSSNYTGRCDVPQVCIAGTCSDVNPCDGVTCGENKVCNPDNGDCVDDYCKLNPNVCVKDYTICINKFDADNYWCPCEPGYNYDFTKDECYFDETPCTGVDCGEGSCKVDAHETDGWYCICDTNMEYLDDNLMHYCIDPAVYNYCTDWNCGVGYCEEVVHGGGDKSAKCVCPQDYVFDSIQNTCIPGIVCGNVICDNPLRQKCASPESSFCEDQLCSSNYPEGTCNGSETCIAGTCVQEECSSDDQSGYCMDGYSCTRGDCCKGVGLNACTTTDSTLKLVGETCNLDTNNCVNDAICLATPTGDGVCSKLCDQTEADTCNSLNTGDSVYYCIGRDVFTGVNYEKIGVCATDDNCDKETNGGCYTNQVCLSFKRTAFTQCYAFDENKPIGSSCSTGTATIVINDNNDTRPGFNVGCAENLLCVDNTCVPNCNNTHKLTSLNIDLCYTPFSEEYKLENLKVKDQGDLLFDSRNNHNDISTCDPSNSNCGALTCIKIQDKDTSATNSKDIGLCSESCDFNSSDYKSECGGNDICFNSNGNNICLNETDCDIFSDSCSGVCHPVTPSLNSCMVTTGFGHIGDACTGACQYGICIAGTCQYPCSIGDNSTCGTETCQSTTDSYINSSSHFGSPSVYGTCQ